MAFVLLCVDYALKQLNITIVVKPKKKKKSKIHEEHRWSNSIILAVFKFALSLRAKCAAHFFINECQLIHFKYLNAYSSII